jgi:hypothetical protein
MNGNNITENYKNYNEVINKIKGNSKYQNAIKILREPPKINNRFKPNEREINFHERKRAKKNIADIILNSFGKNIEICATKNGKKKIHWTYILTSLKTANELNNTILREIKDKLSSSKRCRNESEIKCKNNNIEIQNNIQNNNEQNIEHNNENFKKILKHSLYSIRRTGAVKSNGKKICSRGNVDHSIKIFWKSVDNINKKYTITQRSKMINKILGNNTLVSQIKQKTLINKKNITSYNKVVDWFKVKIAKMKKDNLGIYEKIDRITHLLYMNYEIIEEFNLRKNGESEIAYWYRILGDFGIKGKSRTTIKDRLLRRIKYNENNNTDKARKKMKVSLNIKKNSV